MKQQYNPINPEHVPGRILSSGASMPAVGLGTFGSDSVSAAAVAVAVKGAIAMGYRHIDCASVYGNEKEIGIAIKEVLAQGSVTREELWITSKLWNDKHAPDDVTASCHQSLADLQLDYLDMYLVHWPFPNFHAPGCDVTARSTVSRPYIHKDFMATWRAMETLHKDGAVRHIGTSNMTIPKLEKVLADASVLPAVNEMECHPHFQQEELFQYLVFHDIVPIGYSPIGSPGRPERDRVVEDTVDIEDPVIVEIAQQHRLHPATLCVKWAAQRGLAPIPFSSNPRNYHANLAGVVAPPLRDQDMARIATIDKNCRLIKGQVFLWKKDQGWEDLWDLDGYIVE